MTLPTKEPENFPSRGDRHQPGGEKRDLAGFHDGEIGGQTRHAEKDGHEEGRDHAAQLALNVIGENGRFPDQHAGHESAQHGAYPQKLGEKGEAAHDHQDHGDDGKIAAEIVVDPADGGEDQPAAGGKTEDKKQRDTGHGLAELEPVYAMAAPARLAGDAKGDGDDHPAHRVFHDGGGDDDLAQIAAHEIHLPHHHGHDLDGRDGKCGAQEQGRHQPPVSGAAEEKGRTELAQQKTAGKGKSDAAKRDGHGGETGPSHQLEIGLHAGKEQKHQDADLRQAVDHAFLRRIGRKDESLRFRPYPAEQGWSQDDSGQQRSHQGGLADPLHALAQHPAHHQQQHDLRDQKAFGSASAAGAIARRTAFGAGLPCRRLATFLPSAVGRRDGSRGSSSVRSRPSHAKRSRARRPP